MATTPAVFEEFGGLTLREDPEQVGAARALDLVNVTFAQNGRLVVRDGYSSPYTGGPAGITNLWPQPGESVLASFSGNSVKRIDLGSGTASATASITSAYSSFADAGTATYYSDGSFAQIRKFSGGAFSSPAGLSAYNADYLAVQPLDDRLVMAIGARVRFSGPGTPETVGANDFVDLTPGDAERISGMAVYGTQLFVFKKTKFFVFYGNSVDADGEPVFNYRMVDSGIGCWQPGADGRILTAVHRTGVYFVGQDGVYRTVGGEPVRVSDPIAPVFKGANIPIPSSYTVDTTPVDLWGFLGVAADKLYLTPFLGISNGTYVLDLFTGQWSVYDWPAQAICDGAKAAANTDTNGYRGATLWADTGVHLSNRTKTSDDGTAIAWRYLSGLYQLSDPGRVAITLESRLWGTGTVTLKVANDHGSPDTGSALTLGVSPAVVDAWQQLDREGTFWQHRISGSGPASVNRLVHYISFVKPAGVQ